MSRLLYERGIFRDSGPGAGAKAASAFGWGVSNTRVIKDISIFIFPTSRDFQSTGIVLPAARFTMKNMILIIMIRYQWMIYFTSRRIG